MSAMAFSPSPVVLFNAAVIAALLRHIFFALYFTEKEDYAMNETVDFIGVFQTLDLLASRLFWPLMTVN
jgi:hypothetical protein